MPKWVCKLTFITEMAFGSVSFSILFTYFLSRKSNARVQSLPQMKHELGLCCVYPGIFSTPVSRQQSSQNWQPQSDNMKPEKSNRLISINNTYSDTSHTRLFGLVWHADAELWCLGSLQGGRLLGCAKTQVVQASAYWSTVLERSRVLFVRQMFFPYFQLI